MNAIEVKKKPLKNYLGIWGWIWGGKYSLERYLYTLQRLSGLAIILYAIMHLTANGLRIGGEGLWEDAMSLFENPGFTVGEYLVFAAFIFHSINGLRLILQELGYVLGTPKPPIYPYSYALRRKRPIALAMGALVVVFLVLMLADFVV